MDCVTGPSSFMLEKEEDKNALKLWKNKKRTKNTPSGARCRMIQGETHTSGCVFVAENDSFMCVEKILPRRDGSLRNFCEMFNCRFRASRGREKVSDFQLLPIASRG